jgi:multiple sugar transport system substrate-binding protein
MQKSWFKIFIMITVFSFVFSACTAVPTAAPATPTQTIEPTPENTPTIAPVKIKITWFVGLGNGAPAIQNALVNNFVDKYNSSQSEIELIPVIVNNKDASDSLAALISNGNTPDIVGPVGVQGLSDFPGSFLDLAPLVKDAGIDLSGIDTNITKLFIIDDKLEAVPFVIYPSAIFVNKNIFAEAGQNIPPQKYGDPYVWADGREEAWTFNTLAKLAKVLTLDGHGHGINSGKFSPNQYPISQFGFIPQLSSTDAREFGTFFGAGLPVSAKGTAVLPATFKQAWQWYQKGLWSNQAFIPNNGVINSDLLNNGNPFSSGKVAMAMSYSWFISSIDQNTVADWDVVVIPANPTTNKTTAPLQIDTFAIMANSKHPDEALKVYSYMYSAGAADLYEMLSGLPANISQQTEALKSMESSVKNKSKVKINSQVFLDGVQYMDNPNYQFGLPNNAKSNAEFIQFGLNLISKNEDLNKAESDLLKNLNEIYIEPQE